MGSGSWPPCMAMVSHPGSLTSLRDPEATMTKVVLFSVVYVLIGRYFCVEIEIEEAAAAPLYVRRAHIHSWYRSSRSADWRYLLPHSSCCACLIESNWS